MFSNLCRYTMESGFVFTFVLFYLFLGPFWGHFSLCSLLREIDTTGASLLEKR
jgi:hypothetical protein